jgi:DNA-binding transcriptional MerR regulator
MDVQIPDKLYFKIGEVVNLTGIKAHVLRYWESEFGTIRPVKSRGKQRLYRRQDIELILCLKDLLYRQGYTIAGARKKLREQGGGFDDVLVEDPPNSPGAGLLEELRRDLVRLRKTLMKD